jgi:ABC-2 type transport system permease protein
MPVVQIILFGFALSNEVKNTKIMVFDQDKGALATSLIKEVDESRYFDIVGSINSNEETEQILRAGLAKAILVIPSDFESSLYHENEGNLQLVTDAIDPNVASTIQTYLGAIINDFRNLNFPELVLPKTINTNIRMLYNPQLKGAYTFVPGVIAMILMIICTLMTSVSIVKEKEMGNMELLLVSPTNPLTIIFSKTIPYLFLSLLIVTIILVLSVSLLDVPIRGSIFLLYGVSLIFIIASLALGMVISTFTNSQQVAMLISLMGLMLPTIMFGGFMFPIENMPLPLQVASNIVPAKWFYFSINGIMIKGLGLKSIYKEVLILTAYAVVFLTISYKKFDIRLS